MPVSKYLEILVQFAGSGELEIELRRAKKYYFGKLGFMTDINVVFENYMLNFIDWYVFDMRLPDVGKTPLELFVERFEHTLKPEEASVYRGFIQNIHSLFQVNKVREEDVTVIDLFDSKEYLVKDEMPKGFCKGEIFETRLLPFEGAHVFGEAFNFHPLRANKAIIHKIKRLPANDPTKRLSFIQDLAGRKYKLESYRHVDALKFYED
jgi:hypothetical protein